MTGGFNVGDRVVWTRGCVGLTGTVVGHIDIPIPDERADQMVIQVETANGRFCEYPHNLKVLVN